MIKIINLNKSFDREIFSNVSLELNSTGLVGIYGDSGCGKSTLINILLGIDKEYGGKIYINDYLTSELSINEMKQFRLENIGVVHQDFKLFNANSITQNISLIVETLKVHKHTYKNKLTKLLKYLSIDKFKSKQVSCLSGGEKQRVAIARAILSEPNIIICDEPTGSLDYNNSRAIMKILKDVSKKCLVIVFSHDKEQLFDMCDEIYNLKNKKIFLVRGNKSIKQCIKKLRFQCEASKTKMPLSFILKNIVDSLKYSKAKTIISNFVSSISLLSLGLVFVLTSSINEQVSNIVQSLLGDNTIVMQLKDKETRLNHYETPDEGYVYDLKNEYLDTINKIYIRYVNTLDNMFQDRNIVYASSSFSKAILPNFSAKTFANHHDVTNYQHETFYPSTNFLLGDDSVILGISYETLINLCYELRITRNFESLGNYINEKSLVIGIGVDNSEWNYYNDVFLNVSSVFLNENDIVVHSNNRWNEYFVENQLNLSVSFQPGEIQTKPWEVKKIYTATFLDDISTSIKKIETNNKYKDIIFENLSTFGIDNFKNEKAIFVTDKDSITYSDLSYIKNNMQFLHDFFISSQSSYSSYNNGLNNGFTSDLFASFNESELYNFTDSISIMDKKYEYISPTPPKDITGGNIYSKSNIKFSTVPSNLLFGKPPSTNNDIVVSTGLIKSLGASISINSIIYFAFHTKTLLLSEIRVEKQYINVPLNIVGIVDEAASTIYHDNYWTISFFRDKLGKSAFSLLGNTAFLQIKKDFDLNDAVEQLSSAYGNFTFSNPQSLIDESIADVFYYVESITSWFAIITLFITSTLFILINYLNISQTKNERNIFNVIGIARRDIVRYYVYYSIVMGLSAFLNSLLSIIVCEISIGMYLASEFGTSFLFVPNYMAYFIMFIVSIVISTLSSSIAISLKMPNIKNKLKKSH